MIALANTILAISSQGIGNGTREAPTRALNKVANRNESKVAQAAHGVPYRGNKMRFNKMLKTTATAVIIVCNRVFFPVEKRRRNVGCEGLKATFRSRGKGLTSVPHFCNHFRNRTRLPVMGRGQETPQ